jgi:23S rRNA-intervening sequence protein
VGVSGRQPSYFRERNNAAWLQRREGYQLAFKLAMEVFSLSKSFPEDERYSLTSQIRHSSCSVAAKDS